jgi:hypothetical protein
VGKSAIHIAICEFPDALVKNYFFQGSGLTEIELPLEDSDAISKFPLKWVLNVFAEEKCSKLLLDGRLPLLHLPTAHFLILHNAVKWSVCNVNTALHRPCVK